MPESFTNPGTYKFLDENSIFADDNDVVDRGGPFHSTFFLKDPFNENGVTFDTVPANKVRTSYKTNTSQDSLNGRHQFGSWKSELSQISDEEENLVSNL